MDFIKGQVSEMNFESLTMTIGEREVELILYDKSPGRVRVSCLRYDDTRTS